MTAGELIAVLKKYPAEADVSMDGYDCGGLILNDVTESGEDGLSYEYLGAIEL